ncbi:hypothetical protein L3Q82_007462 [Scortum barcoo]|uniref:Uncharacterized protein n=1 Tax=Scortum barcoo TaxID=214431 RepID=A0ACB8WRM1_9TELE|nr:hypothetical protein L3Q82_007462 [Scortum barcoo]
MSSVSYHISNLLEKMTSTDKDFRFMATNDLMLELQKDSIKLDEDSERKVVSMLLKLLEDKNGEVQNLAVKCLAPLVGKVKEPQVETMVDTLCSNMTSDKEQLRDISSMGLKTVIAELPLSSSGLNLTASVCKKDHLAADRSYGETGGRVSSAGGPGHPVGHVGKLTSPRMAVRKRSILALGHLVPCCSPALFSQLTEHLLAELKKAPPTSMTRTYIQCLATISRQGGHRVGAPKEMSPHVATVTQLCLKFMTFDPNYNYDDEEEEEDSMDIEDGINEESDDEYSDDDDMSWKVRRSSIKCLEALISTRRDLLLSFYSSICPALLARFKEREENVRADVFAAFSTLLRQTRTGSSHTRPRHRRRVGLHGASREEEPAVGMLKKQVPVIVKALHRQLKEKSIKSRQGCFCLLTELAQQCTWSSGAAHTCTDTHTLVLLPPVVACVEDSFYKITSEALLVAQQLIRVMRPQGPSATAGGFDPKPFVREVFSVTLKRLKATDIDQEVKERAISCMGHLIDLSSILAEALSVLGSFLRKKNQRALKLGTLACLTAAGHDHHAASIKPMRPWSPS